MELRWDPILREWVMVSNIREHRPWQPSSFCPFCPGTPETGENWSVLVLKNKYPMLSTKSPVPEKHWFYKKERAIGECLVVVETPKHDLDDLSDLELDHIVIVLKKIIETHKEYRDKKWAKYFFWFRNKGKEIGVSLTHPHSQIYVTPFIPVKIQRELHSSKEYFEEHKECLFCKILSVEEKDGERIVYSNNSWIAFIPFYAHWPFEVHVYPRRHVQWLDQLDDAEIIGLAKALKSVLCGLKNIFEKPMPYMLVLHQAPFNGIYEYYHMHIEIYGVYRKSGKLKYAAGMETGGGNFTYDSTPEENAQLLKRAIIEKCGGSECVK
ncbi:MAG: galactose-1-phosphate uridylyltransferase [Thermoprotei archaeon]|nr:MAG: galactose-1-phosphate uridylyltransferase [Thermoprotei archaeon]